MSGWLTAGRTAAAAAAAAAGLALVVLGGWALDAAPDRYQATDGFTVTVPAGEVAALENLHLTVTALVAPQTLSPPADTAGSEEQPAPALTTVGEWFVVEATAHTLTEPGSMVQVWLELDGRRYSPAERESLRGLEDHRLAAEVPLDGWLAFELPRGTTAEADSAVLEVSMGYDQRLAGIARIELDPGEAETRADYVMDVPTLGALEATS